MSLSKQKVVTVRHNFKSSANDTLFLPEIIHEIAEVIGMDEAIKIASLAATEGGRCAITIPKKVKASHRLNDVISAKSFNALCQHFSGETLYVYAAKNLQRFTRNQMLRSYRKSGFTETEIVRELGVDRSSVYRILTEAKEQKKCCMN